MTSLSLTDKAYKQIKEWIVYYHIKPGYHLYIKELANMLKMSQTPVREALSMLEREQTIERRPQKGYVVRGLSLEEVEDIYELRISLEELAARQAAKRIREPERKRLETILAEVNHKLTIRNKPRILELEQEFHMVILEASGNRALAEMGRALLDRIWIVQNINLLTTNHLSDVHPEHIKVFRAIERGDSQRAAALMKKHITSARDFVLLRLKRRDDFLSQLMTGFGCQDTNAIGSSSMRRNYTAEDSS